MTSEQTRAGADWLSLREPADADARSAELVARLRGHLPGTGGADGLLVHDLGCGTGSMARWLAARLPGPQRWVLHDRDADLLPLVHGAPPGPASDGSPVTTETRHDDITRLRREGIAGAGLVTASALLDMMTAPELAGLVDVCCRPGCPVLIALTVTGRVELTPADPFDTRVGAAFNAHQQRPNGDHPRWGPDAADAAAAEFRRRGREVVTAPSPWQLGPGQHSLAEAWLTGWLDAAVEQDPGLAAELAPYARRRRGELRRGELRITVGHVDLLVGPG